MSFVRNHIFSRFLCLLLALHIFNVSIDMPDAQPYDMPEDLSINDQESFVELVLEKWLGFDDAVAEHDEPGDESQDFDINKEFKINPDTTPQLSFLRQYTRITLLPHPEVLFPQYSCDINPPPPKA